MGLIAIWEEKTEKKRKSAKGIERFLFVSMVFYPLNQFTMMTTYPSIHPFSYIYNHPGYLCGT